MVWTLACWLRGKNPDSWTDQCKVMEKSLEDRSDGEELIDTKVGGVHLTDSQIQPCEIWALACWLCGKILTSERIDGHSWNKFSRQRWWRRADGHQSWRCEFDGQRPTVLPNVPLVYDMSINLLINSNFWTDRCTLMKQSLADRGDEE